MASAKAWLLERKSIYEVGFRDPAYFSRFFRKHAGAPPGEWRLGQARGSGAEAGMNGARVCEAGIVCK